jgi:hypothetical protein
MKPRYRHQGNAMKCHRCGSENRDGASICDRCGKRLTTEAEEVGFGGEVPVVFEGQLLWFNWLVFPIFGAFVMAVLLISFIIGGGILGILISLGVVATGWLSVYYLLSRRR